MAHLAQLVSLSVLLLLLLLPFFVQFEILLLLLLLEVRQLSALWHVAAAVQRPHVSQGQRQAGQACGGSSTSSSTGDKRHTGRAFDWPLPACLPLLIGINQALAAIKGMVTQITADLPITVNNKCHSGSSPKHGTGSSG
jgi:hypothetical protein